MKDSINLDKVRNSLLNSRTKSRRVPRARRKWRVEIINENTLARVMSIRLTGIKARLALIGAIASIVSLVVVIFTFTPLGKWIWGDSDLHSRYVEMSLRVDSLASIAAANDAYTSNIFAILSDSIDIYREIPESLPENSDTLLSASEAERRFVEQFEADSRFNLSVLSPIAAEGMIFESPVASLDGGPVMAVYRGTVISSYVSPDGKYNLVIQHPNDFISSYNGLSQRYVDKGSKVAAGQRIGTSDSRLDFEFWRGGTRLNPENYIQFPIPASIETTH